MESKPARKVVTASEMAAVDARTIKELGIPGQVLMESAGRCVADSLGRAWPDAQSIVVVCGPGNNGGDGFVIARTWANRGGHAEVVLTAPAEHYSGDAALELERARACGLQIGEAHPHWSRFDVIVDAIFGTGLKRPIEGKLASLLQALQHARRPIVAVDIPTGVDATNGAVLGQALRADLTVTFGAAKVGHFLQPGAAQRGRLEVHDIGIPLAYLHQSSIQGHLSEAVELAHLLPHRSATGYKGSFGRVLLAVGSEAYPGAAVLSTRAALRAGAGMVYAACPAEVGRIVLGHSPEVIIRAVSDDGWAEELYDKKALCVGPGLGKDAERFKGMLSQKVPPTVVDADAIALLRELPPHGSRNWIVTPHQGEAARLLGWSGEQIEADRVAAAREIASRHRCVAVLKGAPTLVATEDGRYWINTSGGPVLGQAGTGDVLSGLLTALLGQGLAPEHAARLGVYVHGRAAELRQGSSQRGLQAIEVADGIPAALDELHDL